MSTEEDIHYVTGEDFAKLGEVLTAYYIGRRTNLPPCSVCGEQTTEIVRHEEIRAFGLQYQFKPCGHKIRIDL